MKNAPLPAFSVHRAALALLACLPLGAAAQVRTDSSLGHPAQSLTGPNYVIPQSLGLVSGPNLFQSFSVFNLASNQSADFTTTSPGISNVISRVTGGTASSLFGPISLNAAAGAPNFFFINPAGVTLGAGASLNVPGAVHISTANYLKFPDGNFYSDLAHTSTFSALAPEAFGFLGTTRSTITLSGGTFIATVGVPVSITAGDIVVNDADIVTYAGGDVILAADGPDKAEVPLSGALPALHGNLSVVNGAEIATLASNLDSGAIRVSAGNISIDSQGNPEFTGIYTDTPYSSGNSGNISIAASGAMTLVNGGSITTTTETSGNAGSIAASVGGPLTLQSGAEIYSYAYASGNANSVQVNAGSVSITGTAGGNLPTGISSFASTGTGNAGSVSVTSAGAITLSNFGFIAANSYTSGAAGAVSVSAKGNLVLSGAGEISSAAAGSGPGGNVTVSAGNISLLGTPGTFTGIQSDSEYAQSGPAGNVTISTPGTLSIINSAVISGSTSSAFSGGTVDVTAGSITINGQGINSETGISSNSLQGGGNAGSIVVTTPGNLSLVDGGSISCGTGYSTGSPGEIVVNAGSLYINGEGAKGGAGISSSSFSTAPGRGGAVTVNVTGDLTLLDAGVINADTFDIGNGGAVRVSASNITINGTGALTTGISSESVLGVASDNAGSVVVTARGTLDVLGGGFISSGTSSALGQAGSVVVSARDILVSGVNSSIDAKAGPFSSGQAGDVTVDASESLTVADSGELSISNLASIADPKTIYPTLLSVTAPTITLEHGGLINASSIGNIDAGNIRINFSDIMTLDPSAIGTISFSGNGGSITIVGGQALILDQSAIVTSVFGPAGNGGNIRIKADVLLLDSGFIQANTAARNASGGTVAIDVEALVASDNTLFVGGSTPYTIDFSVPGFNVIQAAAPTGISGEILISTPELDLASSLSALGARELDRGGLGRSRCQTSGGSSLGVAGRGGFAPAARDLVHADSPPAPVASAAPSAQSDRLPPNPPLALARLGCAD